MSFALQTGILPNLDLQSNPSHEKKSDPIEILSVEDVRRIKASQQTKVIERTNDYMSTLYNEIIYPHLQTKSTGRPKAPMILLKLIVGRMIEGGWGRCVVKQEVLGEEMQQYGYEKPLDVRQIKRHVKLLKDIGLIDYKRSAGYKSVYEYAATPKAIDVYFHLIKRNVSYIRFSVVDPTTGLVDKIYSKQQMSRKNLVNVTSHDKNVVRIQLPTKSDVTSNILDTYNNTSPSFVKPITKNKIPTPKPSKEALMFDPHRTRNFPMSDLQFELFKEVCDELNLDKTTKIIFKDDVEKNLYGGLSGGKSLGDFKQRLRMFYSIVKELYQN